MLKMYEVTKLIKKEYNSNDTKELLVDNIENTEKFVPVVEEDIDCVIHFVNNPFLEIKGSGVKSYKVQFYDKENLYYSTELKPNMWTKLSRQYYTDWDVKVLDGEELIYEYKPNFINKRVFISFDSRSLGDSIAWIPYVLEFKKKHNCHVIVSTFWNKLFEKSYSEIEFVSPGSTVHDLIGMYTIGWFYDTNKEPELPNTIPLQKAITNIIGLEFNEIKPNIDFIPSERPFTEKYITIANESTAGVKYWNNPNGWRELIDYLVSKGYRVINVSKESDRMDGVTKLKDTSIENTMNCIHHSEFFIGLSSGLSWLTWALGKHVVMISNFTEPDHEFTSNCTRITNPSVCNGCWNNPMFKFDKGDWNWCPEHKGTERQFECHKSITSQMVIDRIQHLL
jgi:autotransporter strand-loop-strand O-heptosyltransferase